jgi:XTP/dITP diphosphohydrolase
MPCGRCHSKAPKAVRNLALIARQNKIARRPGHTWTRRNNIPVTTHNSQPTTRKLFLASANPGKVREFRSAAQPLGFDVQLLPGFSAIEPCVEDSETFEANARKKALHYAAYCDGLVFADDSGICVDALGGAPGVFSARFAGANASDDDNNRKLLEELHRVESRTGKSTRAAHYVCVIALARGSKVLTFVEGTAHGQIIDDPRGSGGFGYDPYFYFPPLGKTFAEITADDKLKVSHRGEAFRKLLAFLQPTLGA